MPTFDDERVPELPDNFDDYCKQIRIIRSDFFSLVNPSRHLSNSTGEKTFKTLAIRIESFEKSLGDCERKLKSSVEGLTTQIDGISVDDMRKRKLLELELQSKKMFIKIVKQHQKELNSDKFYLMEEMQRVFLITERDNNEA